MTDFGEVRFPACTVPAPLATSNHRVETTVKFYKVFSYLLTLTTKKVIDIQSSL